jgi:hypothetical protein
MASLHSGSVEHATFSLLVAVSVCMESCVRLVCPAYCIRSWRPIHSATKQLLAPSRKLQSGITRYTCSPAWNREALSTIASALISAISVCTNTIACDYALELLSSIRQEVVGTDTSSYNTAASACSESLGVELRVIVVVQPATWERGA